MILLWSAESLINPSWRTLNSSFESWAFRHGFDRRLQHLTRASLLERRRDPRSGAWVYRLTSRGRLAGLGGIDPEPRWKRSWDGRWRMLFFDLPHRAGATRMRLWRWLRSERFGYLQQSVWITPEIHVELSDQASEHNPDVESFAVFEGRPVHQFTDAEVVAGAWDFAALGERYDRYHAHLDRLPRRAAKTKEWRAGLLAWTRKEKELWDAAMRADPLLPAQLLPPGYEGREAWKRRAEVWVEVGKWFREIGAE